MNEEISIDENGNTYKAEYVVDEDTLTVFLPDGSCRVTELRGLKPTSAAMVHLKSYIKLARTYANEGV